MTQHIVRHVYTPQYSSPRRPPISLSSLAPQFFFVLELDESRWITLSPAGSAWMKSASVAEPALEESGWLDSCLFALSFLLLPLDCGSDWSQLNATVPIGEKWVKRKFSKVGLGSCRLLARGGLCGGTVKGKGVFLLKVTNYRRPVKEVWN